MKWNVLLRARIKHRRQRKACVLISIIFLVCAMFLGACSPSALTGPGRSEAPLPAGPNPSEIAKMVCQTKAQHEIDEALGVTAIVQTPTWSAHLYACRYSYSDGSFGLSVKELSSWGQTLDYYHGLGSSLGDVNTLPNLGQGGFQTTNGSVVVRKDWKVLLVDISRLPAQFGDPSTPSGNVAVTIANVVLGCWHGD